MLKEISEEDDIRVKEYADWATVELPKVRAALAASQQEALSTVDVPVLAPLEEDVLWESTSNNLSESAELRPRERGKKASTSKKRMPLVVAGIVVALVGLLGTLAIILF